MANRNLSQDELTKAVTLLNEIREKLKNLAGSDDSLHFAYRRKIAKELNYDERGKPMYRKVLKAKKRIEQNGICPLCSEALPEKYAVLDRLNGMAGYTIENTRLIHPACDFKIQATRKYS